MLIDDGTSRLLSIMQRERSIGCESVVKKGN